MNLWFVSYIVTVSSAEAGSRTPQRVNAIVVEEGLRGEGLVEGPTGHRGVVVVSVYIREECVEAAVIIMTFKHNYRQANRDS